MSTQAALVEVRDLCFAYAGGERRWTVLEDIDLDIARGEVFGLVGESGCGKSTLAAQLLGYRAPSGILERGSIRFEGQDLATLPPRELARLRGSRVSFVPQNPTTALSPGMRVGRQIGEMLIQHGRAASRRDAAVRAGELFRLVGLPAAERIGERYPHELSGGQQQRVVIAMAVACEPRLVVLDEPTTGLDVTTQEQILVLLKRLREQLGMSMLYVTHDLGVLMEIADRMGVMYAGHMVESGPARALFERARHPYTRGLIGALRVLEPIASTARGAPLRGLLKREELPPGCPFQPRCSFAEPSCALNRQRLEPVAAGHLVACQRWRAVERESRPAEMASPSSGAAAHSDAPLLEVRDLVIAYGWQPRSFINPLPSAGLKVVHGVSLDVGVGETLALVGESGSGKSTIARAISGIVPPVGGRVLLDGKPLAAGVRSRSRDQRRRIQYIFQNPDASLNPRARIDTILARPLQYYFGASSADKVVAALDEVRLPASYARRYPDELSGGERQRVAIARALVAEPDLLLCDEILSALDVSVQASILELLARLRAERGVSMLFISHDLAVVGDVAHRIAVLYGGCLMETGTAASVLTPPFHPYTHSLLMSVPGLDLAQRAAPPARCAPAPAPEQGCVFAGQCPWQPGSECETTPPPWRETAGGKRIRCHIEIGELDRLAVWRPRLRTKEYRPGRAVPH